MSQEQPKTVENGEGKKVATSSKPRYTDNILPMARIKKIMKMDQNIGSVNIGVEASYLICTATEKFIEWISSSVYETDKKALSYSSLAKLIQGEDKLDFLRQIVPTKITVREYKKILAEETEKVFDSGSDVSTSSEEEDESASDEDASGEEEESDAEEEESGEEEVEQGKK